MRPAGTLAPLAEADRQLELGSARRRAWGAFAALAAGGVLARTLPEAPSWWWFAGALLVTAFAAIARGHALRAALPMAVLLLGGGLFTARILESPRDDVARVAREGDILRVRAVVLDLPTSDEPPRDPLRAFLLREARRRCSIRVSSVLADEHLPASGVLRLSVAGDEPPGVAPGDRVVVTGVFRPIGAPTNPGDADARLWSRQTGVAGTLTLTGAELITPDDVPPSPREAARSWGLRALAGLRERARDVALRAAGDDPDVLALVRGLLLGEYSGADDDLRAAFTRQGLAHALSISGFHVAVMAAVMLALVRLTGDRGWLEPAIVAALVLGYLLIVPPASPLARSALMVLALLAAESAGRRYDRLTILGWIALALLVWRPMDLWSMGFQLSVGLTASLFWIGRRFHETVWGAPLRGLVAPREPRLVTRLREHATHAVSAASLCFLLSLPMLVYHVGWISPLGILATLLVVPLLALLLWAGYTSLLLGMILPPAAEIGAGVIGSLARGAASIVHALDALPFSGVRTPPVSPAWALASTAFLLAWCRWGSRREARWWIGAGALGVWLLVLWTAGLRLDPGTHLRIDMLDVGNGTCHIVRSGRHALLWDCAPMTAHASTPPLRRAARALGVHETPTLVVTHPDIDHFGGLADAVEHLGVRTVLVPERFLAQAADHPHGSAAAAISFLAARHVTVRVVSAGESMVLGSARLTFVAPSPGSDLTADNDHSLVALVTTPSGATAVLTGDAGPSELARLPALRADILEVPHHGSYTPGAVTFVEQARPRVVLQSTGRSRLDDPRWGAARRGVRRWLCTARDGAAWSEITAQGEVRAGSSVPQTPAGEPRTR